MLQVALGLGCGQRGLCDALVAKERIAFVILCLMALDAKGEVFPNPIRFFKVP